MKIFSYFYRIISWILILSFSGSISAISIEASTKDSLSTILEKDIFTEKNTQEISEKPSPEKTYIQEKKNTKILVSTQEIKRNTHSKNPEISHLSSAEIQRILETVIQKKKQAEIIKTKKTESETCKIPAKIPQEIKIQFAKATENIPCELLKSLRKVEVFEDPKHIFPRAMANGRILKIRSDAIDEPEFIKVLIHELGHVVDLGGLKSKNFLKKSPYKDGKKIIYADDKSVLFYEISWINESEKRPEISDLDFVGGYASNDMFEDYAESFLMYLEHGNEFRMLAKTNFILSQKYQFFREEVFQGKEFSTGESFEEIQELAEKKERPWDITKL